MWFIVGWTLCPERNTTRGTDPQIAFVLYNITFAGDGPRNVCHCHVNGLRASWHGFGFGLTSFYRELGGQNSLLYFLVSMQRHWRIVFPRHPQSQLRTGTAFNVDEEHDIRELVTEKIYRIIAKNGGLIEWSPVHDKKYANYLPLSCTKIRRSYNPIQKRFLLVEICQTMD